MGLLIGKHVKSVDSKGRIVIPHGFRECLEESGGLVLTKWFDRALALFPEQTYAKLVEAIVNRNSHQPQHRAARYQLLGSAVPVALDGQGRLMVPEEMLQFTMISDAKEEQLVIMGDWDKIILTGQTNAVLMERDHSGRLDDILVEAMTAYPSRDGAEMACVSSTGTDGLKT